MEVAINYTLYLGDLTYDDDTAYIQQRHLETIEELGYELKYATCGIHRNAKRTHLHYHTINKISHGVKIYKILNAKIKNLKTSNKHTMPHMGYVIPEVKISFNYSTASDYDQDKILMYPLKEYEKNKDMLDEVVSYGLTKEQLEVFRSKSNEIYEKGVKEQKKKDLEKMEKTQTKKDLYSYLDLVIHISELPEGYGNIEYVTKYTIKRVLQYYKENNKNFSIHQLKNVAINYLYFKEKITENNIIDYINL